MVSLAMLDAARRLQGEQLFALKLPHTEKTPIPGLVLYLSEDHQRLEMVLPNGVTVNLLAVHKAAWELVVYEADPEIKARARQQLIEAVKGQRP